MPNIKPVSDLRNYNKVLNEVSYGNPVYLTRNGHGDCAIVNMREFDELKALNGLFEALSKGESSALEHGWIPLEDALKELEI